MASIYGAFNKVEDAGSSNDSGLDIDGLGNSVNGSLNITSNARGTMIMGVGNTITHAKGPDILGKDEDTPGATGYWVASGLFGADYYAVGADTVAEGNNLNISYDEMRNAWQKYMETSGGAVSVLGNSNNADYAIRSQILGTGNTITGSEKNMSAYNTVSGFANTGTNIKRSAIVGTGNTLKNGEDNVVIGDYHNLENGKHNVILGSMDYTEKQVTKQSKSAWAKTYEHPDGTFEYTVTEQVPVKNHTEDIENAVMVGYNTDVTQNGGVALGSDSVASTEAGKTGYDALGRKHAKSDKDYAAWNATDAAVSVGGADREIEYDVLDKDGKPETNEDGSKKTAKQTVKSTRQITNLAAGTEDTDAVNVAQMKVTATAAADAVKTHFYSVNSQDTKAGNYNNDGAKGKSAINAIAAGVGASSDGDSSIAVGTNSRVASNGYSLTSIAIGKNAHVLNGTGQQEYEFGFDKDKWNVSGFFHKKYTPKKEFEQSALADIAGGIAIGTNSYARTGSIDIGGRTMDGRTMAGMVVNETGINEKGEVYVKNPATANIIDMTTVGTNSYNKGLMATIVGSYSINTGDFNGNGGWNSLDYGSQNMGSTIVGSLNQNRSLGKDGTSGVANSIIGVANVVEGANGALIFGAGNKVSNSIKSISGFDGNYGADTVDDLVNSLSSAVKESESGGSTLVIGGGNTADYTQRTQIIGVNNTITGTSKKIADYNMVDGFNTTANNISHVYTIGYRNDFNNENNSVVIGDYHQMTNGKNNVVIGSYDGSYDKNTKKTTYLTNDKLEDAVMIGHNAEVQKNSGVALGAGSVASVDKASVDKNAIGYDPATKKPSTVDSSTWKSTAAAVSVGDASKKITRQITNVAAGTQDTDAVNVAQLKAAQTHFYSVNSTDETADNYNNDGAKGKNSLAAGVGALANGSNSVAIGTKAKAQNDALAVGESANAGNNGIAIGMHANAGYGQNMALGYYASVANGVSNSTALGYGSQVTKRDILQSDGSDGVVSVGKSVGQSGEKGMTRRIINVKDGVKATDAANVSQLTELKEGEHISITDSATPNEKGQTVKTISVKVDGQIEKGNTGILSGDTVYKEVHVDKDGNYIKSGYTVAENLNALDGKVKTNADNIEKNGQAIEKNSARIDTNSKNIEKNGQAIEKNSARIDTNSKNIEKNSQAIEKNSTRIDTNSKNIETLQKTKADTNLSNITDAGKTVINNIAKKSVKVEAGSSNVSVTTKDVADGPITYTVDVAKDLHVNSITSKTVTSDSVTAKTVTSDTVKTKNLSVSESASIGDVTINKGNQGTIDGLKNTAWDAKNITSGRAATEDQVKAATKNAVNYDDDTSKTITLREDTTIKNVANTAIEQGSKNAVNAGTVYNETRVKQDGEYVKASNTAGENLSVLDNQVASNSSNITNLNGRVNNLDSKVNKVGAGAAALAALHPLDFDPEDKWDFAVGYGNYRDANSVAVGAFYRPDDDTMFSVGTNFGNGENMINAGVSFKFGPKGKSQVRPGSTQEITELRATVARQDDQLKKQDNEIKELKAMVQQLMAKQDKQATTK